MSFDDNREPTSDTLESVMRGSKKKIIVVGTVKNHYSGWMDLLCIKCDSSLMIIQLNDNNTKIKVICHKCENEIEINIKKLLVGNEKNG